jgi:hypothetical protein
VILLKPIAIDGGYVKAQYMEKIGHKKGYTSGSKYKFHQYASKEGKKKWTGKDKNKVATTH